MDNKKQILDFALDQLKQTMQDIKDGKPPTIPKELKRMSDILSAANDKLKKNEISEEDMDKIMENVLAKIKEEE